MYKKKISSSINSVHRLEFPSPGNTSQTLCELPTSNNKLHNKKDTESGNLGNKAEHARDSGYQQRQGSVSGYLSLVVFQQIPPS